VVIASTLKRPIAKIQAWIEERNGSRH